MTGRYPRTAKHRAALRRAWTPARRARQAARMRRLMTGRPVSRETRQRMAAAWSPARPAATAARLREVWARAKAKAAPVLYYIYILRHNSRDLETAPLSSQFI